MTDPFEFRTTDLESRLGAMRLFLASLLAHLDDNGLIDRGLFETDFWRLLELSKAAPAAHKDMLGTFEMARVMTDHWKDERGE